ncbi:MAG: cob(I)yrinic acid a,c-diamide adenosyltransferase [Kiloniellales bacterium]
MVRLTRIYTRGGDKGETSLGDGARVKKHDARVAAFGEVDEANAAIGLVRLEIDRKLDPLLAKIQNDLFDLGADLCRPADPKDGRPALRVTAAQVEALEQAIDQFNVGLKPLESFVLPAGSRAAAALHLARTVTRRAERAMTALAESGPVNPEAIKYMNRLSDLLFVLARLANDGGAGDVLWRPGGEAAKS